VTEFADEEIEKRQHKIARANGYRLESHDMVLYGVCKDCG
jgi:Fur family ferric uptake transcriptional regulator